ncbi:macro domain-containing protein [Candidatus Uhrbacteria bacterium]|nr:macro domain-containing protein [Candidatus Uhrbacteria bacterium]
MSTSVPCTVAFVDFQGPLCAAWRQQCAALPASVEVVHGTILMGDWDAVVSPANSFGFMDGGIDRAYTAHFGPQVQERLQESIRTQHYGELLVGAAAIVPTDHPRTPYCIAAPTMRVPMILGPETVHPYLATRAALLLVRYGTFPDGTPIAHRVQRIAFPGMGTGIGRVPLDTCARQMCCAVREVLQESPRFPSTWQEANERHQLLYRDQVYHLQG